MDLGEQFFCIQLRREQDVVVARQRARQIAGYLQLDTPTQIRIATVVSELARHLLQHTDLGLVAFSIYRLNDTATEQAPSQTQIQGQGQLTLRICLSSRDDGQKPLTDAFAERQRSKLEVFAALPRLLDEFRIESVGGTSVIVLGQRLALPEAALQDLGPLRDQLQLEHGTVGDHTHFNALSAHNEELSRALEALTAREVELARVNRELQEASAALLDLYRQLDDKAASLERANIELEETNRGIIALYAELDEKASSLQKASEMKTSFLSHVSHEIRTPLNAILSLSSLLLDRTEPQWQIEQDRQVGVIHTAAGELAQMVDDLLDTAKVEAGKAEMHYEDFSIADLFASLRGMFKPIITKNGGAELSIIDDPELPRLFSDRGKIAQILRNFISNAVKFTPAGEIRVTATRRGSGLRDSVIEFTISDTGIGISSDDQARLFQEFSQVGGPQQRRVKGTGLGLALTRKLATLLGGQVSMRSELGQGSTFTLEVPQLAPDAAVSAESLNGLIIAAASHPHLTFGQTSNATNRSAGGQPSGSAGGGERSDTKPDSALLASGSGHPDAPPRLRRPLTALIIDDQETARYLLGDLLAEDAIDVVEAASGLEGLSLAVSQAPELIFLDLIMPGMDGLEVLRLLKSDPKTSAIPVIVHSSKAPSDFASEEVQALLKLATGYVRKQGSSRTLALTAVRSALTDAGFTET